VAKDWQYPSSASRVDC